MNEQQHPRRGVGEFSPNWAEFWRDSKRPWVLEFTPLFYYEHLRKEIEREDGITNQRLTWAMSLHGFLIASMTFLLSGAWPPQEWLCESRVLRLVLFRELALGGIGLAGLAVACVSLAGVRASRTSIDRVKDHWDEYNRILHIVPSMAPQAFGHGATFPMGTSFAVFIPAVFVVLWSVYLVTYIAILGPLIRAHIIAL